MMQVDTKTIEIHPLQASEMEEADRICKVAFGTFLGAPDPSATFGDRSYIGPRWRAGSTAALAAKAGERLIGSNVVSRWGSFGFFGPLTVLPEFWDQGVAKKLLEETMGVFERWGIRHSGLFTFAHSAKHVGLYQKFGYWPLYLTAIMKKTPEAGVEGGTLYSDLDEARREQALRAARELTNGIFDGLDLSDEIRAAYEQRTGDTVMVRADSALDSFAVCHTGPGSEGGSKSWYVKFGAARGGLGAGERFDRLLAACEEFAADRGVDMEAGVNLAREDAYRRMRARGYNTAIQGVAMQRPHEAGFNRGDAYVIDDWR